MTLLDKARAERAPLASTTETRTEPETPSARRETNKKKEKKKKQSRKGEKRKEIKARVMKHMYQPYKSLAHFCIRITFSFNRLPRAAIEVVTRKRTNVCGEIY